MSALLEYNKCSRNWYRNWRNKQYIFKDLNLTFHFLFLNLHRSLLFMLNIITITKDDLVGFRSTLECVKVFRGKL